MSIRVSFQHCLCALCTVLIGTWSQSGFAGLGGLPLAQTGSATVTLKEVRPVFPDSSLKFTLHSVVLQTGTIVQEWVSSQGQVFSVRWQGPTVPDLGMVLGTQMASFRAQSKKLKSSGVRGAVSFQTDDLVALSTGHARDFHGYAYLQSLVPAGVDVLGLVK